LGSRSRRIQARPSGTPAGRAICIAHVPAADPRPPPVAPLSQRRLLYVARHGETDWNLTTRWQGHTDVPLNETGRAQARQLGERLRGKGIAAAVASDLSRAQETARIVAGVLGIELAYVDRGLRERQYGVFEGLTRAECETRHAEAWSAWLASRTVPPGAEAHEPFTARVVGALAKAADAVAPLGEPLLVVAHGGAMRAMIATATHETPPMLANGAVWVFAWEAGRIASAHAL
jgi:broad specificity phosphatase PhoE